MALSGIFQGLSQGSEQSLARNLYIKKAQEEQNRQDMMRAEDVSFRNKQFDAGQQYQNQMIQSAKDARIQQHSQFLLSHGAKVNYQDNMFEHQQDTLAQNQNQFDANLGYKQDALAQNQSQFGQTFGLQQDAQTIGEAQFGQTHDLKQDTLQAQVDHNKAMEKAAMYNSLGKFLEGGDVGGSGYGSSGGGVPGVSPQSIELSQDQINTYANDLMNPLSSLNVRIFGDKKMTANELNTFAKEQGQAAANYVANAGHKPGSVQYKFYVSSIYNSMLAHPEFKRVRDHAPSGVNQEVTASNFRKQFYEGSGLTVGVEKAGGGATGTSDNIKSQIDNALGGKKMNREQKKSQRLESAGEILGQDIDEVYQERGIRGMMAEGARVGGMALQSSVDDYIGRPLGWMHGVWSGPQRVEKSNAPQSIKSHPDVAGDVPNQVQAEQNALSNYATEVNQLSHEQLLDELDRLPPGDPRIPVLKEAIRKKTAIGIIQGMQ